MNVASSKHGICRCILKIDRRWNSTW